MNDVVDMISDLAFLGVVPLGVWVLWELHQIRKALVCIRHGVTQMDVRDEIRWERKQCR